jgi:hypothetical protein
MLLTGYPPKFLGEEMKQEEKKEEEEEEEEEEEGVGWDG